MQFGLFAIARSLWHAVQRKSPAWLESSLLPNLFQSKELVRLLYRPMLGTSEYYGSEQQEIPGAIGIGLTPITGLRAPILAQWPRERPSSDTPFWRAGRVESQQSAELIAIEGPAMLVRALPQKHSVILPKYVSHSLDVTGGWQDVYQNFHRSIRNNELRWVRKYGYRFERTTDTDRFEFFYENMYLPTINARHGSAAALTDKDKALGLFKSGFLLLVFTGDTWVAGALCEFRSSGLRLCELGVLGADGGVIKQGVMGAIYVAAIQAAISLKCRKLDLTVSTALLANGTFQHKRRWGTSVSLPISDQNRLWIHIPRYSPAVHEFLVNNPMITLGEGGRLHALVAIESLDRWTAAEEALWRKHYFLPGLDSIKLLPLDEFRETGVPRTYIVEGRQRFRTKHGGINVQ